VSGIILAFCAGVIVSMMIFWIRGEMASRKIRHMEYEAVRRLAVNYSHLNKMRAVSS
jgi:hypothetical protein